jgi:Fic family protein
VGRILLSYILVGQGLINVAIKGISKQEREQYYNALEKSDRCFNELHRLIEKNKKLIPVDVNKVIKAEEFNPFTAMINGLLKETISRLEGGQLTNLNKETILPLRDLAKLYDYSQDYLRNLINRGQLKAHKKGKLWYVRVQDLADHINKQK